MTKALDLQLDTLKHAAEQQTDAYSTSRDQLHQAIVDAYTWWREADATAGYLDATYKAAGIATRKRSSNSPNFYPLVRLVWRIDISKQAGTVSNWAKALLAVHNEFAAKPKLYEKQMRADLINYIKDSGGLSGLRGEKSMSAAELEAEEADGTTLERRGRPKMTAPASATVTATKLEAVKGISAKATITSFPTAVTNSNDLVVMIGRRNAVGQIEVLGSGYDDELIEAALYACTKLDRSSVTPSLSLLVEALEAHALPLKLEKYRKKFFDDSEVEVTVKLKDLDKDGKPKTEQQKIKQATRLRYRPATKDFLISKAITPVSIVTYAKPHATFDCNAEVILRGEDRSWIERELLSQQKLTLYSATPNASLTATQSGKKASHMLSLEDVTGEHKRNLYFYEKSTVPTVTNTQASIANRATIAWDWQLQTTVQWLAEFDAKCASPYVNKIRGFFNQTRFASLQLAIGNTKLQLSYWLDEKSKNYAESYTIPYNTTAKRVDKKQKDNKFTANAKDIALVFSTLPTLPITSNHVLISGNSHIIQIKYSTELADYETFISASDADGTRDVNLFELYGA